MLLDMSLMQCKLTMKQTYCLRGVQQLQSKDLILLLDFVIKHKIRTYLFQLILLLGYLYNVQVKTFCFKQKWSLDWDCG